MRRVRRANTGPELALRRELTRRGMRYRVDYARAPGRPDIAMVGRRVAVFVDGEFWHGKKLSAARLAEMSGVLAEARLRATSRAMPASTTSCPPWAGQSSASPIE